MSDRRVSLGVHGAGGHGNSSDMVPSDVAAVRRVLRSMGVEEYEPRVLSMLTSFCYKYAAEVLGDAEAYALQAGRPPGGELDVEDVMLAIQTRTATSFAPCPPTSVVMEAAAALNEAPLPEVRPRYGLRLPREADMLVQANWQINTNVLQQHRRAAGASGGTGGS